MVTAAIVKGIPIEQVQTLLGHEKMTQHLDMLRLRRAILKVRIRNISGRTICVTSGDTN